MVARRIRIERTKTEESESGSLLSKVIEEGDSGKGRMIPLVLVILLLLSGYHTYDAYQEEMRMEEEEKKEGLNCLYQFRTEDCNPMKLNDKCTELLECVQQTETDLDEMEIISNTIKKTSRSLSETLVGPVALMVGVALFSYIRKK
jgi:hypothetical protein